MPPQHILDRAVVRHLVEHEELPHWKIAEMLGVSRDTIGRRCRDWGLQTQTTGPRRGDKHPGWQGGRKLVKGYWYCYAPDHPHCTKARYVLEHRLVMEHILGRYLTPSEVVHHKDGNTQHNHPDNLEVFASNGQHLQHELTGRVPQWTPAGWSRMQAGVRKTAILKRLRSDARRRIQTMTHPTR